MRKFEKEFNQAHPELVGEKDREFKDREFYESNYMDWLETQLQYASSSSGEMDWDELWDKYSERIDDDIDSLQIFAGKDVITKQSFFKMLKTPPPPSTNRFVLDADSDNAWPTKDVLSKLIWATEYLLNEKDYDGHGHEEVRHCVERGKEILKSLTPSEHTEVKGFELSLCDKCVQMTNHLNGVCQKCKPKEGECREVEMTESLRQCKSCNGNINFCDNFCSFCGIKFNWKF